MDTVKDWLTLKGLRAEVSQIGTTVTVKARVQNEDTDTIPQLLYALGELRLGIMTSRVLPREEDPRYLLGIEVTIEVIP